MKQKTITYSALSTFQTCRRKYKHRYLDGLVPIARARPLGFGTITHEWLKVWHETSAVDLARKVIDQSYPDRDSEPDRKADWHYQTAMLRSYAAKYPDEDFKVVGLEREFAGPLVNPDTNRISRSFRMRGKVDGLVRKPSGEYCLLEHKTVATLTGDYMERVSLDAQIGLYVLYLNDTLSVPISTVLYNILQKPKLVQSRGETQAEFEVRAAELAARNKSGKSSARRKLPESDEAFQARLASWHADEQRFIRLEILLDYERLIEVRRQLWDIGQELLYARRKSLWHRNTLSCFGFGRCEYWPICSSGGNPNVIENFYRTETPHSELENQEHAEEVVF